MGYRAISDAEMNVGQPITSNLLAQIRDNLAGISAGGARSIYPVNTNSFVSGALAGSSHIVSKSIDGGTKIGGGWITQAKIQSAAVGFNNIKIGTNQVLATSGAIATGAVTSAAGIYILGWLGSGALGSTQYQAGPGSGETATNAAQNWLSNTAPQTHFWVYERSGVGGAVAQVTWTYIAASPPYELAGEPVPVFVFAIQRRDGSLQAVMVMDDAPWGPGAPTEYRDGKPWIRRRKPLDWKEMGDANGRRALLMRIRTPETADFEEYELTTAAKNRDMDAHPHPFPDVQAGERVVMVEPTGEIAYDLAEAHRDGQAGILIAAGDIRIGDEFTLDEQPMGVALVRASWR